MFIELKDGVVRLDPDAARDYAHAIMPQLRNPSLSIAAEFAAKLRRTVVPYRLVHHRVAAKAQSRKGAECKPCEYCGQIVPRVELKFCGRQCYLRHSVEVRKPILKAQAKLNEMRAAGLNPGHGGEAARKRGEKLAVSNKRRSLNLTEEEWRERRALKARVRRAAVTDSNNHEHPRTAGRTRLEDGQDG
jgi:hypothetical protein